MNDVSQPLGQKKPKLLDRVRYEIRTRHYSGNTEAAYVAWIKRFIFFFHAKRHPAEMGAAEVAQFLSSLAVHSRVSASTQNQAMSALLFLYKEVLQQSLPWLDNIVPAKRPTRLPVVLSRDEVQAILARLNGIPHLMATLLYGAGLRLLECCRLRVKDVDLASNQIVVPNPPAVCGEGRLGPPSGLRSVPTRARSRAWCRLGRDADGAGPEVSECGPRVGLAVGLPGHADLRPSGDGSTAPAPPS